MDPNEYARVSKLEEFHWWYRGLREIISVFYPKELRGKARILDAGCGTGALLKRLRQNGAAVGVDVSTFAIRLAKKKCGRGLVQATVMHLPFRDDAFDLVTSMDVLYHVGVSDDVAALAEIRRVMRPGGRLLLNLPAYNFLKSRHDEVIHTKRRYSKGELEAKVVRAGMTVERMSNWNTFLFPVICAVRLFQRLPVNLRRSGSDLELTPPFLNSVLFGLIRLEASFLMRMNFPVGLSIFSVLRKETLESEDEEHG